MAKMKQLNKNKDYSSNNVRENARQEMRARDTRIFTDLFYSD